MKTLTQTNIRNFIVEINYFRLSLLNNWKKYRYLKPERVPGRDLSAFQTRFNGIWEARCILESSLNSLR